MESGYAVEAQQIYTTKTEKKNKNFLDRWVVKRAKKLISEEQNMNYVAKEMAIGPRTTNLDSAGMNFKVYKANGGYVIETNMYDRKIDRHNNGLHIVTKDQDLGQEIAKIITMECLRA